MGNINIEKSDQFLYLATYAVYLIR